MTCVDWLCVDFFVHGSAFYTLTSLVVRILTVLEFNTTVWLIIVVWFVICLIVCIFLRMNRSFSFSLFSRRGWLELRLKVLLLFCFSSPLVFWRLVTFSVSYSICFWSSAASLSFSDCSILISDCAVEEAMCCCIWPMPSAAV